MDWLRRERPEVKTVVSAKRGTMGSRWRLRRRSMAFVWVIVVPFGNSAGEEPGDAGAGRGAGGVLVRISGASEHAERLDGEGWHRCRAST